MKRIGTLRGTAYPAWLALDTALDLATSIATFAMPLILLAVTNDPLIAGVTGSAALAVRAVSTLVGGPLADRHSRPTLMLIGAVAGVCLGVGLFALLSSDKPPVALLAIASVALQLRTGLFGPAAQAALKDVVPASALGKAQASNQARDAVTSLLAAPLGGVLLATEHSSIGLAVLALNAVAVIAAARLPRSIRRQAASASPSPDGAVPSPMETPSETPEADDVPARGLFAAARWLFSRADLRGTLIVSTIVNLGFAILSTAVIYSLQQAGTQPVEIAMVSSGIGLGLLVGAAAAAPLVSRVPAGILACGALVLLACAGALVPLATQAVVLAAILGVGMSGVPALNAGLVGYFMVATPQALMGRAIALLDVLAICAMPLAPLVVGLGLGLWGRTPTLLIGWALCVAAAALALGSPQLRGLPREAQWSRHAAHHGTPALAR